jgi:hypothetical protein
VGDKDRLQLIADNEQQGFTGFTFAPVADLFFLLVVQLFYGSSVFQM